MSVVYNVYHVGDDARSQKGIADPVIDVPKGRQGILFYMYILKL